MKRLLVVLFALSFCQFASASQSVKQITNGGFEELDKRQLPVNWDWFALPVGKVEDVVVKVTTDAVEGKFALYMESRSTATVGVNRVYRVGKPGEFIPEIGALLPFKKGALVFQYKVIKATSDNVRVYAIPMKADNIEGGASRAVYIVPAKFSGDNKWHIGVLAFDFSDKPEVRAVQIGLRINEGGISAPAAVIFDDFRFAEKAGWHLRLSDFCFVEGDEPKEQGYLVLSLQNTGDEPALINAQLSVPKNFESKAIEVPSGVAPKDYVILKWLVRGKIESNPKFTVKWESMPQIIETLEHTCSELIKRTIWEFNRDDDPEGWEPIQDLESLEVKGGILKTRSTGSDPYMHSPPIFVMAKRYKILVLRLKIHFPKGSQPIGQVFWIREDDSNWSESKSIRFPLPTDGQWHELKIDLSQSPEWSGMITKIRLDPGSGSDIIVELDYIRME